MSSFPLRDAVECVGRDGLPNCFAKLEAGAAVTVAYFGGSITSQTGWRVQSLERLRRRYPNVSFSEVDAAIGGTGSNLGVFRLGHDVSRHKPDLLFVEFAVNDSGEAPEAVMKSMEGIVRQTWRHLPSCDICFVYTLTEQLLPDLRQGKFPRANSVMEMIADHYGVPSVHLGLEVVRLEMAGKLAMTVPGADMTRVSGTELDQDAPLRVGSDGKIPFAADGVHPYNDTGHRLYTEALERSWPKLKAASGTPVPHPLPPPLDAKNLEEAKMLPLSPSWLSGAWTDLPDRLDFGKRIPALWKGAPGAELSFRFKGSTALLYDLMGHDCGTLELVVDGESSRPLRIDGYCTYRRLATLVLAKGLEPRETHTVRIKVLGDKLDKGEILFERNLGDLKANPEKYVEHNWYVGALLLLGELVD